MVLPQLLAHSPLPEDLASLDDFFSWDPMTREDEQDRIAKEDSEPTNEDIDSVDINNLLLADLALPATGTADDSGIALAPQDSSEQLLRT